MREASGANAEVVGAGGMAIGMVSVSLKNKRHKRLKGQEKNVEMQKQKKNIQLMVTRHQSKMAGRKEKVIPHGPPASKDRNLKTDLLDPLNGVLTVLVTVAPVFITPLPVATPLPPPALPEILCSRALALEFPARSGVAAL